MFDRPLEACVVRKHAHTDKSLSSLDVGLFAFSLGRVVMGDINPRDNEGMTPLHCAAHFSRPKHISLLCEGKNTSLYKHWKLETCLFVLCV